MEDHVDPRVDMRHRISAFDDNYGGGDEGEDAILGEICGRSRERGCGVLLGVELAGIGESVFRGGK